MMQFNSWCGLLLLFPFLCISAPTGYRPNIVIALADDMGFGDVGYNIVGKNLDMYDQNIALTPNLDALSSSNSVWNLHNFHSETACSPSRMAILSGKSPLRDCVWGNPLPNKDIYGKKATSVAKIAKLAGYRTLFLGKHLGVAKTPQGWPSYLGFQNWTTILGGTTYDYPCACKDYDTVQDVKLNCFLGHETAENVMDSKSDCYTATSPKGKEYFPPRHEMEAYHLHERFHEWVKDLPPQVPFFVQISFRSVHNPFVSSPELRERCLANEICNPNWLNKSSLDLDYGGTVFSVDDAVGRIRNSIRVLLGKEAVDNTIFIFLSDNGPSTYAGSTAGMKGRKRTLFEGLLRVPALFEWPRVISRNMVLNRLVSMMDIPVTLIHAITGELPQGYDGVSLLPAMIGEEDPSADRSKSLGICSVTDVYEMRNGFVCERLVFFDPTGRWKLIANRKDPLRKRGQASFVDSKLVDLYDMHEVGSNLEEVSVTGGGQKKLMIDHANLWLEDLFASFRARCKGYY